MDVQRKQSSASTGSFDPAGGTLLLKHAYRVQKRLDGNALFTTYLGTQSPFERTVVLRFYRGLDALGLPERAVQRLRGTVESGGLGELAVDVGDIDDGSPFLVLKPPTGPSLREWVASGELDLRKVGALLWEAIDTLPPGARCELSLDAVHVSDESPLRLEIRLLGDLPTRNETRDMNEALPKELALHFPPECFLPSESPEDNLERTAAADVYRLCAVLYELANGEHPLFRPGKDVAESVADLVSGLGIKKKDLPGADEALGALVKNGLNVDPSKRPSWAQLGKQLGLTPSPTPTSPAERTEVSEDLPVKQSPSSIRRVARMLGVIFLMAASAAAMFFWLNRPPSEVNVLLTSEPTGTAFQSVEGNDRTTNLGRTPLLIPNVGADQALHLRPVYEDGSLGEIQNVDPEQLQLLDACRSIHMEFEAPSPD
ncbi:MAG: hypothetical protein KC561_06690 [Myxococcales bacterium]|nr:hypothetical protein [Myxococcales bacterium]